MKPSISVIVPTFNRAGHIAATLQSVLAQSLVPREVIIIDDGSQDDTATVVESFGDRVVYVRQDNAGVSAARNHGARLATGDYLAFVDSDDTWHARKLEIQLLALERYGAGWCISGCDVIDHDGNVLAGREGFEAVFPVFRESGASADAVLGRYLERGELSLRGSSCTVLHGDAYDALFLGNFGLPSSAIVARPLFTEVGGFDPAFRMAEETEFFHRLAAASSVAVVMTSLVGYRVGQSGSLTSPANTAALIGNALTSIDRAAALRPARTERATRNWEAGRRALLRRLAYTHLSNLDRVRAREALQGSWAAGAPHDAWSWGVLGATFLPDAALRMLHQLRRRNA